jgi:hypothetical protein
MEINMYGIDLAVSILDGPNLSEHRRQELALARRMALAIGVILNTDETNLGIRVESAKDLVRELRCVYPETGEL